ncbi:S8 family serine peptidase [Streptomyces sp. NPDC059092]|uniref:S8 family serine peptidase n=1 Tax=Streptomyces sp. NPDC059092 TaxID=3346725 RepID=UPI003677F51B
MTGRNRAIAAAVAVVLAAVPAIGASAAPLPEVARVTPAEAGGAARDGSVVTLITGDRVHVNGAGDVTEVRHAKGRESVRMSVRRIHGSTYVIPADSQRLIADGTLDRRLFDVTGLIEAGYDDASRDTLPLIVSYGSSAASARSDVAAAGASAGRSLPAVRGEAVRAPKTGGPKVWQSLTGSPAPSFKGTAAKGIERIWLDGRRQAVLDKSVAQIGAPTAWEAGYTGEGVKIAVLDTGVDETHPDLAGVEIAQRNFSDEDTPEDRHGHGTHVASIAAGSGAKSGGTYKGVAPGAKILDAKVLEGFGGGYESSIIAGMQWAADQGADIANMSLSLGDTAETDPMEEAVERLSEETGILFVAAAGNSGPDPETVGSPGSTQAALTVGAVDRDDRIASFSSTGPTADGSLKPDITAPGVNIVAARSATGWMGKPAADGYVSASGTSMAAPHVAGSAAIVAQRHPDWSGARIKQALTSSAKSGAGLTPYQQGTGRTDLVKALAQTVVSEQTSVNFGAQRWPHTDDKPLVKTVTYRNDGTGPVTFDLALETYGPDGAAAPGGFFALGAQQVTVEPGKTAEVEVTADTSVGAVDGAFSGTVTATATEGGQSVRTTVGAVREIEMYDLTMRFLDNKGAPAEAYSGLVGLDSDVEESVSAEAGRGEATIRVPKGEYTLESEVLTPAAGGAPGTAVLIRPKLSLTRDTTITLDGRDAKPLAITTPDAAEFDGGWWTYDFYDADGKRGLSGRGWIAPGENLTFAGVGEALPAERFRARLGVRYAKGSTAYNLIYSRGGNFFTGYAHRVDRSELALVNVTAGASVKNKQGRVKADWEYDGPRTGIQINTPSQPLALPAVSRQYVSAPAGYQWDFSVGQQVMGAGQDDNEISYGFSEPRTYEAGKSYDITYNVGVLSPKIRKGTVTRYGDTLSACPSLYADGARHIGTSQVSEARTVVTADGGTVYDAGQEPCLELDGLNPAETEYTISTDVSRNPEMAGTSTRTRASWTFTSASAGDEYAALPLSTLGFSPELTAESTAKAGTDLTVPVTIEGPAAGEGFKSLAVEASYDDGTTWQPTEVATAENGGKSLTLSHPEGATSVSLKAELKDKDGNTYDLTIIKAYLLA